MRRTLAILFLLVALSWSAAPLLACMTAERAMMAQGLVCCKHMAEMCGSDQMPQTQSCCQTGAESSTVVIVSSSQEIVPTLHVVTTVPVLISPQFDQRLETTAQHHRPPGEFLPNTTILRI